MVAASETIKSYFARLETETHKALALANLARKKDFDPESKVDIPLARNMAERVLGLISTVAPQIDGVAFVKKTIELEEQYAPLDWRVGFRIAEEVAKESFCKFSSKKEAVEVGIRTGFSYLTGGIVSAPLEGFVNIIIKKRADGLEYVACVYAGPIRGAGGTAAATSVVLSDYVATKMGYAKYDPTENEISRLVTEIQDYNERVTNLQYLPSEEEIRYLAKYLPIEVDGEPTEQIEVSNHKDLPRIETNFIRGGVCLVIGEGLTQKAPKIWKRLSVWGTEFGIDWNFLEGFITLQKKIKSKGAAKKSTAKGISPNYTFINDLVAGRPVLGFPMEYGSFRLRLGRSRASGFSAIGLHPATMAVLNDFIVFGTQLKLERPGKAGSVTLCEAINGPIVLFDDGSVQQLETCTNAQRLKIVKILFLGDILINYGDFSENGHSLVPLGYCPEWWNLELKEWMVNTANNNLEKAADFFSISSTRFSQLFNTVFHSDISVIEAFIISERANIPLHPKFLYYYTALTLEEFQIFITDLIAAKFDAENILEAQKIIFHPHSKVKSLLEKMGIPHILSSEGAVVIQYAVAYSLIRTFSLDKGIKDPEFYSQQFSTITTTPENQPSILTYIEKISPIIIRDKAGTFIGARMGRPEKAKMRKLPGSPQVLFPVGEAGGRLKSFQSSMEKGEVTGDFPLFYCQTCKKRTVYKKCHVCNSSAEQLFYYPTLNKEFTVDNDSSTKGLIPLRHRKLTINIRDYVDSCLQIMKTKVYPDLIKGVKGTSNKEHIPEHLLKGFLRAKYDLYVNKEGTTRYDMSESPITAFKPSEIGVSVEKLRELGYEKDLFGNILVSDNQIVEIFPQDIIVPSNTVGQDEQGDDILYRTGLFIDDLLQTLYKEKPYYNFSSKKDAIGCLIICLAPHISCGTIGRIIGFSQNQVMLAHPLMHAALRRDCDGDEACFILLMDAFLNFSRQYLPDRRGTRTMDAPLVLSISIVPAEVDDQVHGVDVVKQYPLELYRAAQEYKMPWEVKVEQLKHRINTPAQYEGFFYTHPVENINAGPKVSAYKTLPSMHDKLAGQMQLATLIRAVNPTRVATMVIQKHFIKDIKGNLRKFSYQEFRCLACNEKYRRPPLIGKCTACGGKIAFTISEGSIVKYLGPSLDLAKKYNISSYLSQTLELTQGRTESVFGKEKEIQSGLSQYMN